MTGIFLCSSSGWRADTSSPVLTDSPPLMRCRKVPQRMETWTGALTPWRSMWSPSRSSPSQPATRYTGPSEATAAGQGDVPSHLPSSFWTHQRSILTRPQTSHWCHRSNQTLSHPCTLNRDFWTWCLDPCLQDSYESGSDWATPMIRVGLMQ